MSMVARTRHRLEAAAEGVALAGGIVLTGVALLTVVAVISDAFGVPVLGDSEMVELAVGAAVAGFLPVCQMAGGHVAITLFTDRLPRPLRTAMDCLAAALMLIVAALLTWRLGAGGVDAFDRGRSTMFLQLPLWWGFLGAFLPCVLWVICAGFVLVERLLGQAPATTSQHGAAV
ncbi:MAG: TRAP transporter small permease [Pararhodobacter sp.]